MSMNKMSDAALELDHEALKLDAHTLPYICVGLIRGHMGYKIGALPKNELHSDY